MQITAGIIEIDVHGKTTEQAIKEVYKVLQTTTSATYRIRIIHGYHGGTRIRDGLLDEFSYQREPRIRRITAGNNPGITELILREF